MNDPTALIFSARLIANTFTLSLDAPTDFA
jgi:hypothetical protein